MQELLFYEGLSMLGIANWDDIAYFIGTKTNVEVENFFYSVSGLDNNIDQEMQITPNTQSNPNTHDIGSFMPLRKDFEIEYENDYESIFKEVNNDTGMLFEHKKLLQEVLFSGFENLTRMRTFKKHVILDKDLINLKELEMVELKPIAKFLSKEDFNSFYSGLLIELELEKNITEGVKAPLNNFLDVEKKRTSFLSDLEKEFCFKLKLSYKEYLKIKCKLMEKKLENDHMDVEKCKALLKCHDDHVEEIFYFLNLISGSREK